MPVRTPRVVVLETTTDRATALRWWEECQQAGLEGIVAKRGDGRYRPGQRDWPKIKYRHTIGLVVSGDAGPVDSPTGVVLMEQDRRAGSRLVATSQPLSGTLGAEIGFRVRPTGAPRRSSAAGLFGRQPLEYTPVAATVVVEVATDGVHEDGRLRHAVRVIRVRHDLL